jgi:hypothetical protein
MNAQCCFHSCALLYPTFERRDLRVAQRFVARERRHPPGRVGFGDLLVKQALIGFPGTIGAPLRRGAKRVFMKIEPEVGLACRGVGTVTEETVIRQNGTNVALEIDARLS